MSAPLSETIDLPQDRRRRAVDALAEKPDGVVEAIAAKASVTPAEILAVLPDGAAVTTQAAAFEAIWSELASWGKVLFIVHTGDIVLEVTDELPSGSEGHGWFNIHGDGAIGGHIRKDNCVAITFVDRLFHGKRSCSVWFMNADGAPMFKIFVKRNTARELEPDQLAKFEALASRFRA